MNTKAQAEAIARATEVFCRDLPHDDLVTMCFPYESEDDQGNIKIQVPRQHLEWCVCPLCNNPLPSNEMPGGIQDGPNGSWEFNCPTCNARLRQGERTAEGLLSTRTVSTN